jgi:hypothetical protein
MIETLFMVFSAIRLLLLQDLVLNNSSKVV